MSEQREQNIDIGFLNQHYPQGQDRESQGRRRGDDSQQAGPSRMTRSTTLTKTFKFEDIEKSFNKFNGQGNIRKWISQFNEQSIIFELRLREICDRQEITNRHNPVICAVRK